jgi:hypothetical protein
MKKESVVPVRLARVVGRFRCKPPLKHYGGETTGTLVPSWNALLEDLEQFGKEVARSGRSTASRSRR